MQSENMQMPIRKKENFGFGSGNKEQDNSSRTKSTPLEMPPSDLREPYLQPTTVKQLTSQVNDVATKVLKGSIELETARVYSALIRSMAQMIGTEMIKARLTKTAPNLKI